MDTKQCNFDTFFYDISFEDYHVGASQLEAGYIYAPYIITERNIVYSEHIAESINSRYSTINNNAYSAHIVECIGNIISSYGS